MQEKTTLLFQNILGKKKARRWLQTQERQVSISITYLNYVRLTKTTTELKKKTEMLFKKFLIDMEIKTPKQKMLSSLSLTSLSLHARIHSQEVFC